MASKKASFQLNWLQELQFSNWLEKVPNDAYSARCKLCLRNFSLSNMGRRALSSHMNSAKHMKHTLAVDSTLPIQAFISAKSVSSAQCTILEPVSPTGSSVNIKDVIKMLLILSHGNATLERGFSINKEIVVENMKETSLIAQRMIFDAVTSCGGLLEFASKPIPKKMIHSMRNAYSRYKEAEDYRKQTMTEKDKRAAEKRKLAIKVKELEANKAKLLKDAFQEANVLEEEIAKLKKHS